MRDDDRGFNRRKVLKSTVAAATAGAVLPDAATATDHVGWPAVDDFERSDPLAEYGANAGQFGVETSTVYEGSQALVNASGDYYSAVSTSGLDRYPGRGDEVTVHFDNAGDDNFVAFHFFAQSETDNPDGYTVGISGAGAWRMWNSVNGSVSVIASQDLPTSDQIDGWYRAEVRTDDTNFSSGGIGFRSAGNGEVWDYTYRPDLSAPQCSIASPSDGATVGGTTTVQVDASDAEDDDSLDVEVAIDAGTYRTASYNSTSGYYEYDWDTTASDDGDHTIDARATDSHGATTNADQVTVTVDNAGETIIEGFERTDPLADYGAATDLYSVTTATVYEGSQALVNDGGDYGSVVSTSGLDTYPSRGEEFHYRFDNAGDDNFVALHFMAQSETDNPDGYTVGISGSGAWRMWNSVNGSVTQIASQDLPTSDQIDGWYRAEVRTDDTTVYADLYDDSTDELLASIQADDANFSSGGIGFRSAGNGEVWDFAAQQAASGTVVDDFERTDPLAEYGANAGQFGVETSTVYEGSQALVNASGDYYSAVSTSGLDVYPDRGDEVTVHFDNAGDDNFVAFHFFAQSETDNPDGYTVGISGSGAWRMWNSVNGSVTQIASQDLPTSDQIDGWYRAEVWTDSTTVSADLYDDSTDELLASIQADDANFSSGGIGFRSAGNGEVWDYVVNRASDTDGGGDYGPGIRHSLYDGPVGGGDGMPASAINSPGDADIVVSDGNLQSAIDASSAGDVIYVEGSATASSVHQNDITIAGNRGEGTDGQINDPDIDARNVRFDGLFVDVPDSIQITEQGWEAFNCEFSGQGYFEIDTDVLPEPDVEFKQCEIHDMETYKTIQSGYVYGDDVYACGEWFHMPRYEDRIRIVYCEWYNNSKISGTQYYFEIVDNYLHTSGTSGGFLELRAPNECRIDGSGSVNDCGTPCGTGIVEHNRNEMTNDGEGVRLVQVRGTPWRDTLSVRKNYAPVNTDWYAGCEADDSWSSSWQDQIVLQNAGDAGEGTLDEIVVENNDLS